MNRSSARRGRVLGVDSAGGVGWVGIRLADGRFDGAHVGTLRDVVDWSEPVDVIGVDIPIGNVGGGARRADAEARRSIGPRASSVFAAPPALVLDAVSYEEANRILAAQGVPRLSRQAWALVPKMVEAAAIAEADERVHEVHPEVSFRELAGEPLRWSKKTWNGFQLRRSLLAGAGIGLPDTLPEIDGVAVDDVVDAAAAAWSARRIAAGSARSIPNPPEHSGGREVAIWC